MGAEQNLLVKTLIGVPSELKALAVRVSETDEICKTIRLSQAQRSLFDRNLDQYLYSNINFSRIAKAQAQSQEQEFDVDATEWSYENDFLAYLYAIMYAYKKICTVTVPSNVYVVYGINADLYNREIAAVYVTVDKTNKRMIKQIIDKAISGLTTDLEPDSSRFYEISPLLAFAPVGTFKGDIVSVSIGSYQEYSTSKPNEFGIPDVQYTIGQIFGI